MPRNRQKPESEIQPVIAQVRAPLSGAPPTAGAGGGVLGPGSSTVDHLATFADSSGAVIKDSGSTVASMLASALASAIAAIVPVDLSTASVTGTLPVPKGGTGATTFTSNAVLYGNAAGAVLVAAVNATATKKFLQQVSAGVPTFVQLAEADLSVTDVPTNNVSITAHGFAPKAPNDAGKYLDGTGAYSVPPGTASGLSGLTATRVPFAASATTLVDDADMTFVTDTLTVTKIIASTSLGVGGIPTARLHLPAGTAAAGSAPFKLTTGTSLTAPEPGAFEFTTDTLSFTITTGAARKTIAFAENLAFVNAGNTFTAGVQTLTSTTSGGTLKLVAGLAADHVAARINNTDSSGYSTLWMGGSNDGFIRGGSTAGAFTNQMVFLTSGTTSVGFVVNNTLQLLVDGTTGNTRIYSELTQATSRNFSWTAKTVNTVYQAASDGLVVFSVSLDAINSQWSGYGYTDAANPPTTIRCIIDAREGAVFSTTGSGNFTMPVRKGDYYKVEPIIYAGTFTTYYWWVPLGTAG